MMTIKFNPMKNVLLSIITVILLISFSSCSQKIIFKKSTITPAAEGYVLIKSDRNNNYSVNIKITNLAQVERIEPPQQTYIVWMETDMKQIKNIGRIASTNNLTVTMETVSAFKPIKIFITAENDNDAQFPSKYIILETEYF